MKSADTSPLPFPWTEREGDCGSRYRRAHVRSGYWPPEDRQGGDGHPHHDHECVFEAVKALGIEEKDISTESLYLNPSYDWTEGRQNLRGYEANQQLRVKVRDLDKVSDVLSAVTNAGANQVGGVTFTIDDPQALRAEAREKAIQNAQEKAQVLADQLGVNIVKLQNFNEGGGYSPPTPYMAKAMEGVGGGAMDAGVSLPPGEQEIQVNVNMTYVVED